MTAKGTKRPSVAATKRSSKTFLSAASSRAQLLVRIPLIGGFNASEDDAKGFSRALAPLAGTSCKVEALRYHEYGKDKWARCGLAYKMENAAVSDEQFKAFCKILSGNGLEMIRT